MEDVRSVAAGFWVGVGSRDEAPALAGASHFLEHLLFKGTQERSATAIAEAIDEVGGDLNAFTTREYTAFEVRLLAEHLDLGLDILSDIFWSPAFRPEEVEAERSVILEEILMSKDEPEDLVHDLFGEAIFPGHPLGRPVLGDEHSIEAMARDGIAGFHHAHYRPEQVVVAAAGNLDHDAVVEAIAKRTPTDRPGGAPPPRTPPAPLPVLTAESRRVRRDSAVKTVERDTEQTHLVLGVRTPGTLDPDRHALELINQALGGGISSRLFQEVRERRGLAYSVYSYRAALSDAGALAFYAGTAPRNAQQVLDLFNAALDDVVARGGLTDRELAIAKGQVKGSTILGLEDTGARMGRIGRSQLVQGEVLAIDDLLDRIEAVTPDDLARVAARIGNEPRSLAAIGPTLPT
jgi:predicted Zn-dependent peptidase